MTTFAETTIRHLLDKDVISRNDSILAVCASEFEHRLFLDLGFENVTVSNLDLRVPPDQYVPYTWSHQNASSLTFTAASFDFCFVHAGLHHCDSPHLALLEMYRVSRRGVIVLEARDSWTLRLAARMGFVCTYELEAVIRNKFAFGGVNNSPVPNYVYRWTEREFEKTLKSYDPTGRHQFMYFHGLQLPFLFAGMSKNRIKLIALYLLQPFINLLTFFFKRQMNHFAMIGLKPREPWPWLERDEGGLRLSRTYAIARFKRDFR